MFLVHYIADYEFANLLNPHEIKNPSTLAAGVDIFVVCFSAWGLLRNEIIDIAGDAQHTFTGEPRPRRRMDYFGISFVLFLGMFSALLWKIII